MRYQKPKGTADILPNESASWQYVERKAQQIFETYDYHEIRTPIFESYHVFERSSGESSDIVSKEMYDFKDKGNRHIALRPEGTAGVVRAYVEHKLFGPEQVKPYKVYYHGPMFRYERPQSGRLRQFHQIGVEAFGSTEPSLDVEVMAMAMQFLTQLKLGHLKLVINSLGDTKTRQAYHQALVDYLTPLVDQLSEDSQRRLKMNPLRILDSKEAQDQAIVAKAPQILSYLTPESKQHFEQVRAGLDSLGIDYTIDQSMVRGLDYYTDTIFEIMVKSPAFDNTELTVLAGGRYDGLVEEFGGPKEAGIGFGLGVERLLLLLGQNQSQLKPSSLDFYLVKIGNKTAEPALRLLQSIRQAGFSADQDYLDRKVKTQYRNAERLQARFVLALGEDELKQGKITFKSLKNGQTATVSLAAIQTDFQKVYQQDLQALEGSH